ncbi:MAG TPA: LLM class flavin-dependent oxidoreductase [Acetobacteraceae bacterium]|jgi:alkanesulfonate monooxygenase SsuD/methylene tetrahydromethanopterin reductase-like flavin-dependent oxidoreductase (luciferase family)|nr:LLM class flavin-dependent oxidoreductase [Acetobacteraceae bacterium]
MQVGIQFFPDVGPAEKPARDYWQEALQLVALVDRYGYSHVRTIEHYFNRYGGYSPNPMIFLAAAAQVTRQARLVTGAVLPAFNNPLKLAAEIGMLDALCDGRLDVGFARAFLPHEFGHFGVKLDESRARFDEGVEQVRLLLEHPTASSTGQFHSFQNVTSLPRPTQQPRPPFYVAALASKDSFERTGAAGHGIMAIPMAGGAMAELIGLYREAWQRAGHPGCGTVMLAFHMLCHEYQAEAERIAHDPLERYLRSLVAAASDWVAGTSSVDYKGYDQVIAALARETFETQVEKCAAWIGTPERILDTIATYQRQVGGFEIASLQVNFNTVPLAAAEASMRLFGERVLPRLAMAHAMSANQQID